MKKCRVCGTEKSLEDFYRKRKGSEVRQHACKECTKKRVAAYYASHPEVQKATARATMKRVHKRNKQYLIRYLMVHPCVDCGESDIQVLQFDHIEMLRGKKTRPTNYQYCSLARLQLEINKCEIRCANCHMKRTRRQMGWWLVLDENYADEAFPVFS